VRISRERYKVRKEVMEKGFQSAGETAKK